jgi:hypothetical protein
VGQERLGPSYFFISLVLGPLNSLLWYVPSLRNTRGLGWRTHCGVEVTESSTNKHHHHQVHEDLLQHYDCTYQHAAAQPSPPSAVGRYSRQRCFKLSNADAADAERFWTHQSSDGTRLEIHGILLVLLRMAPLAYLPRKNSARSGPTLGEGSILLPRRSGLYIDQGFRVPRLGTFR